jgi:hypothetical protein
VFAVALTTTAEGELSPTSLDGDEDVGPGILNKNLKLELEVVVGAGKAGLDQPS